MARFLDGPRRRNPSYKLLGIDLEDALAIGIGLTAAGALNDKVAGPIAKGIVAPVYANPTSATVADSLTTLGMSALVGAVADKLVGGRWGDLARLGGGALAVARAFSVVVPGWQLSAETPDSISLSNPFAAKAVTGQGSALALPPGNVPARPNATGLSVNPPGPASLGINGGAQGATYIEQFPSNIGTAAYALQGGI